MSDKWAEINLGDFIELRRGFDLPSTQRVEGTVPIISSSGFTGFHNKAMVKAPGVVTGRYGTIGEIFYVEKDFWPLNTTLYVRDFKGNDSLFVYYLLKTINFNIYCDKAAVPGVNRNHLHLAKIYVPTNPETQRKIALRLWTIDKKIELNNNIVQTLRNISIAIFNNWFVTFEPVKVKGEPVVSPDYINKMLSTICDKTKDEPRLTHKEEIVIFTELIKLFPDELVESELGFIPKGWSIGKYADLFEERNEKVKNNINVKVLSAIQSGELKLSEEVFSKQVYSNDISNYKIVYKNDLAFNPSRINIGSAGFSKFEFAGAVSPIYTVLRMKDNTYNNWADLHLRHKMTKDWISTLSSGSVRQSLSTKDFLSIPAIIPPLEIINIFNKLVSPINKFRSNLSDQSVTLSTIRDYLLPKLISREINVDEDK